MTLTDRLLFPAAVVLAALLGLLLVATPSRAGCNYYGSSYSYAYPTYYEAPRVEVKKVVAVEYLAVPVVVPAYAVGYAAAPQQAPAAAPAVSPCDEKVRALSEKLAALEARVSGSAAPAAQPSAPPAYNPPQQPQPPPMAPVANGTPPGKSVVVAKCAGCHDANVAQSKGGRVVLSQDGQPVKITPEVANKSLRAMLAGTMPKNGQLTDQEFTGAMAELLSASK